MGAAPIAIETPSRAGYFKTRRGLAEDGVSPNEPVWNYRQLMRRAGPTGYCVMQFVIDGASYPGSGGYGEIDLERDAYDLGVTPRQVRTVVGELLEKGLIAAHPEDSWRFRPCFENFADAPPRPFVKKPRKPVAREVHHAAPASEMYFTQPGSPAEPAAEPPPVSKSEIDFTPEEKQFPPRETYCPWGWQCPLISSELPPSKNLEELVEEESKQPSAQVCTDEVEDVACSFPDDEGEKLQFWLSRQPWGFVSSLERRALSSADLAAVLAQLRASRFTPAEFVEEMKRRAVTIAPKRENIPGLLITLIRALRIELDARATRAKPASSFVRASDIKLI